MTWTQHKRHPIEAGVPNVWLYPPIFDPDYLHRVALRDTIVSLGASVFHDTRVLDVGCGWMPYRGAYDVAEYQGVDIVPHGSVPIDLVKDDGHLPRSNASVDLIVCWQVLEHVRDLPAFHRELQRCLAPGGEIRLTTHGMFRIHAREDFWRWTAQGLLHHFEDEGWTDVEVTPIDDAPSATASAINALWGSLLGRNRPDAGTGPSLRLHQAMCLFTNLCALALRSISGALAKDAGGIDCSTYLVAARLPSAPVDPDPPFSAHQQTTTT